MTRCLIYNTTGEPLELVHPHLGLVLHLRGKAEILETVPDHFVRSVRQSFPLPASVVLRQHRKVRNRVAPLTNGNLFLRDGFRCGYCGRARHQLGRRERLTRDHLVPRSKGGPNEWQNVVTACNACNHRKNDRLTHELTQPLRLRPWVPTRGDLLKLAVGY